MEFRSDCALYGQSNKAHSVWNTGMILLGLYVILSYIAQETLLPPVMHSVTMYAFVGWSALMILHQKKIRVTSFTLWYLSFFTYAAISMLWGVEAETGCLYVMFVAMVLTFCIINTVNSVKRLEGCLQLFVIAADIMSIMLIMTGQITFFGEKRLGESITGNANSFSALLMVSAMFAGWFSVFKRKYTRIFHFGSFVLQLFLMGLSGGRKTLAVAVACYVFLLLTKETGKTWKRLGSILRTTLVLALCCWAVLKIPVLYDSVGRRFEGLFTMLLGGKSTVSSDFVRQRMLEIGIEAWWRSPLWGYGLDTFKYYNARKLDRFYYAHNNYVELLYDFGCLGTALYYGFYIHLIFRLRRISDELRQYKLLGLGVMFGLLVYDLGGISYYTVLIQIVLSLMYSVQRIFCGKVCEADMVST